MSLLYYEDKFSSLRMYPGGGSKSPHKVALLLAIIGLIEKGQIKDNQIYFDDQLKQAFKKEFEKLASKEDSNRPHNPFFHLRSEGFWHHQVRYGRKAEYDDLTRIGGPREIEENIEYGYFDDALFEYLDNAVGRKLLGSALLQNLTQSDRDGILKKGNRWNLLELEVLVSGYFEALSKELSGIKLDMEKYLDALVRKLKGRKPDTIKSKSSNISAILVQLGQPYVQSFVPDYRNLESLKNVVLAYLGKYLDEFADAAEGLGGSKEGVSDIVHDWNQIFDSNIPEKSPAIAERPPRQFLARKINFAERENRNRSLGKKGEEFVYDNEREMVRDKFGTKMVNKVKWCSEKNGDGLGYDILSCNPKDGSELYIEVKTTNSGKYTHFFMSANEVAFSKAKASRYRLYRVYNFSAGPRIFQLKGSVKRHVYLSAENYKASFS